MTIANSLQQAQRNPGAVHELRLTLRAGAQQPSKALISKLKRVTKLTLEGPEDGSLDFPAVLLELPIRSLKLVGFHVYEVAAFASTLRELELVSHFLHDDIGVLCKTFPDLTSLRLESPRALVMPLRLGNELAALTSLKSLSLIGVSLASFPPVILELINLESLTLESSLLRPRVHPDLARLIKLRHLSLFGSKPLKSVDSVLDDLTAEEEKVSLEVTRALGGLTGLESLNLGRCGVTELSALKPLTKLHTLNLTGNGLLDLGPISALTALRELDLSHCELSFDLSPIAGLPLQRLNLLWAHIQSPLPLLMHPTLEYVTAARETKAAWRKRAAFKRLPARSTIREGLTSKDLRTAKKALATFIAWAEMASTHDSNACGLFFDMKASPSGERGVELPELSALLERHGPRLELTSLVSLTRALLGKITHNFTPAHAAIELITKSGSAKAQQSVVDIFEDACAAYDAGHRWHGSSVHDSLIDLYFPEFEPAPLARLLIWCSDPFLDDEYGDGLDALFPPAFAKLKDPQLGARLFTRFRAYALSCDGSYLNDNGLLELEAAMPALEAKLRRLDLQLSTRAENDDEEVTARAKPRARPAPISSAAASVVAEKFERASTVKSVLSGLDPNEDLEGYLSALARIAKVESRHERDVLIAEFVVNRNNQWLRVEEYAKPAKLLKTYVALLPRLGHPASMMPGAMTGRVSSLREMIASDAVVLVVRSNDSSLWPFVKKLLPPKIVDPVFAYNLACLHAVKGEKEAMLAMIKTCVALGKHQAQFMADSDFDAYQTDPSFLAAFE